jgi:hypothetical protein
VLRSVRQDPPQFLKFPDRYQLGRLWLIASFAGAPSFGGASGILTAAALIVLAFYARAFALTAQDRVIRLEMRQRLRELLPASLQPRINDFSRSQLVALRFASDAELPDLAAKVLTDGIQDKKTVRIQTSHRATVDGALPVDNRERCRADDDQIEVARVPLEVKEKNI